MPGDIAEGPWLLARFYAHLAGRTGAAWIARMLRATMTGAEHVPRSGGVLIVANHTLFGADSAPLVALLAAHTGRVPRFLGERNLWKIPGARRFLDAFGTIPGEPDSAVRLLQSGELVVVYPGGTDDSFKTRAQAYTLQWKQRAGFARVAMRAHVPIVPIASTGIDELYRVIAREPVLGRRLFGSPRYDFPIPISLLPRRVKLTYHVLPPVDTSGDPADAQAVESVRRATYEAIDHVLREYRNHRKRKRG